MTEPTIVLRENVETYVAAVGRRLADLPDDDRVDLLEELRQHATSLCHDDPDVDLVQRLGTPVDYALELRDAAGLPVASTRPRRTIRDRFVRLKSQPWWPVLVRFARDMTPVWWVLRGVAVVMVFRFFFSGGTRTGLVSMAIAGVCGWWLGPKIHRWSALLSWRRIAVIVLDLVAAIVLIGSILTRITPEPISDGSGFVSQPPIGVTNNGSEVTGIYAFTIDGKPVSVALYDQYGKAIETLWSNDQLSCPENTSPLSVPYRTPGGRILTSVTPLRAVCVDPYGVIIKMATIVSAAGPSAPWTSDPLPAVGERVIIDEDGNFAGVEPPTPGATPPAVGSPSKAASVTSPSPTR